MKRLVYSPKVYAFVRPSSLGDGQYIEITDHIVRGNVKRVVNAVSTASLTLRNPQRKWTQQSGGPIFHPMDPITIWMSRYRDKPVQVFTGYLDQTPYFQLYPGTVTLEASCTLKRLLHTYWDPALPFSQQFMHKLGWFQDPKTGQMRNLAEQAKNLTAKDGQLTDGSMGRVLYEVLTNDNLGKWTDDEVFIQALPPAIVEVVQEIYKDFKKDNEELEKQLQDVLGKIVGTSSQGSGGTSAGTGTGTAGSGNLRIGSPKTQPTEAVWAATFLYHAGIDISNSAMQAVIAWMRAEGGGPFGPGRSTYNPLNTTRVINKGETSMNSDGVKCYKTWADGMLASVETILLPAYAGIRRALASGTAQDVANAIAQSHWGTIGVGGLDAAPKNAGNTKPWDYEDNNSDGDSNSGGSTKHDSGPANQSSVTASASSVQRDSGTTQRDSTRSTPSASSDSSNKLFKLCNDWQPGGGWGGPGGHHGLDMLTDGPKVFYAPCRAKVIDIHDGWWGKDAPTSSPEYSKGDGVLRLEILDDHGWIKKGTILGYGHGEKYRVKQGDIVEGGDPVCESGFANAWHIHFFVGPPGSNAKDGQIDQAPYVNQFEKGVASDHPDGGAVTGSSGGGGGGTTSVDNSTAAAFATELEWPSIEEQIEAVALRGEKSLMNDKPLMPFVQQLCSGSLRSFQSLPNGDFFAFFPDYFGNFANADGPHNSRMPYWNIDDIEILDGKIQLNDDALATHVYVVGDTGVPFDGINFIDRILSGGVVTIFNAFKSDKLLGGGPTSGEEKARGANDAIKFLEKFGARPYYEEANFVRSPYFEAFLAFQTFQLLWSRTFLTEFQFTFMPELFPGGIVSFQDYGLQCYIDSVQHDFDYEGGFTTTAQLSAPAAYGEGSLMQGLSKGLAG